jgi:hypothetical protein
MHHRVATTPIQKRIMENVAKIAVITANTAMKGQPARWIGAMTVAKADMNSSDCWGLGSMAVREPALFANRIAAQYDGR